MSTITIRTRIRDKEGKTHNFYLEVLKYDVNRRLTRSEKSLRIHCPVSAKQLDAYGLIPTIGKSLSAQDIALRQSDNEQIQIWRDKLNSISTELDLTDADYSASDVKLIAEGKKDRFGMNKFVTYPKYVDVVETYLSNKKRTHQHGTYTGALAAINYFSQFLEQDFEVPLEQIYLNQFDDDLCSRWRNYMRNGFEKKTLRSGTDRQFITKPSTISGHLVKVKSFFKTTQDRDFQQEFGNVQFPKFDFIDKLTFLKGHEFHRKIVKFRQANKAGTYIPKESQEALWSTELKGLNEYRRHFALFMLFTGMSRIDAHLYTPEKATVNMDTGQHVIAGERWKNDHPYVIPITKHLQYVLDWFEQDHKIKPHNTLMTMRNKDTNTDEKIPCYFRFKKNDWVRYGFEKLQEELELPRFTSHDFRRTFITNDLREFKDIFGTQLKAGHLNASTTLDIYNQVLHSDVLPVKFELNFKDKNKLRKLGS